jgi:hypothetical protein
MKRRIAVMAAIGALLVTALFAGPSAPVAQANHNPLHSLICLVRAIPILPPDACPGRDG